MLELIHHKQRGVFKIEIYDLAIIGAGPIGLFAAQYGLLHNLKIILFDSLPQTGGQPQMLYPFKQILDVPAYPRITGRELIYRLNSNLNKRVTIKTKYQVRTIKEEQQTIVIDNRFLAKSVLIATGNGAFKPKKLPFALNPFVKPRVHYFINQPRLFAGQKVAILGGGDSAFDFALQLKDAQKIILIHRRNQFRGLAANLATLKKRHNVRILTPYLPQGLKKKDDQLLLQLKEVGADKQHLCLVDQVIVAYGLRANSLYLRHWGLNLTAGRIKIDRKMQTNLPHVFAVGDAVTYPGRVPLIGVGFGEAQIAINAIMTELFPQKPFMIHSTSLKPKESQQ